MGYSYDVKFNTRELERRIRHMTDKDLRELYQEVRGDSYLLKFYSRECEILLDEAARVLNEREERQKRNELRDAIILFCRSNAYLGKSLESVAIGSRMQSIAPADPFRPLWMRSPRLSMKCEAM